MRILKISETYYPYVAYGGPPTKVRGIAKALRKRGHQVTVLTAYRGPLEGNGNLDNVRQLRWNWSTHHEGIESVYLKTTLRYRSLSVNPGVLWFCRDRLRDFDIVHVYGLYDLMGPTVTWLCRRWKIPYVVEPLGMTNAIDRSVRLKTLWKKSLGRGHLEHAAKLIATSELEQRELLAAGFHPENIVVRYNGIDAEEFQSLPPRGVFRRRNGIAHGDELVLFLGRIIPRKGADHLIEALVNVKLRHVKLVIAGPEGENGYQEKLRRKAKALGIGSRVLFAGPLYGEEKKSALVDADVFALPSRYENFGNSAAEAMASGTPVVTTDRCGISSFVRERAGLVIPYDVAALTQALADLLSNKTLYSRFKAGCAEVVRQISWDSLAEMVEQSYAGVQCKAPRKGPFKPLRA